MLLLIALGVLAAAAAGSVVVYQRGAAARLASVDGTARLPPKGVPGERPRAEPTLETLQQGDVVLDGDEDFVVAGTLQYREEQDAWALHALDGGAVQRFLEVRSKAGVVQASFLEPVEDAPLFGSLGQGLTYRGKALTLEARGDARATALGEVQRAGGLLRYARFTGPGGALLIVEDAGHERRALFGHLAPTSSLSIYPGELNRARS
ncbi:MAG: DUF4178 domain-containing protein [Deltaproteobacteria bacterium]|nr:DUF4178 domain-containing protein [Deltaproteobacteria bacterium]